MVLVFGDDLHRRRTWKGYSVAAKTAQPHRRIIIAGSICLRACTHKRATSNVGYWCKCGMREGRPIGRPASCSAVHLKSWAPFSVATLAALSKICELWGGLILSLLVSSTCWSALT